MVNAGTRLVEETKGAGQGSVKGGRNTQHMIDVYYKCKQNTSRVTDPNRNYQCKHTFIIKY